VNDTKGPIGKFLRDHVPFRHHFNVDDKTFAMCFVSLFMQIVGILQIPTLLGPSFSPFEARLLQIILNPFQRSSSTSWKVGKVDHVDRNGVPASESEKKRQKSKNKSLSSSLLSGSDSHTTKANGYTEQKKTDTNKEPDEESVEMTELKPKRKRNKSKIKAA
jgi:hypothetical protein